MTLEQFITKYEGKSIGYPHGSFIGECLSLVKWYIKEVFNIDPPVSGCNGARCYWSVFNPPLGTVFRKIPNTPDLVPERGWIAVWNGNVGGGYGHIGIVLSANVNSFVSFDQNWGSRNAIKVTHNYNNVYGFLAPLQTTNDNMQTLLTKYSVKSVEELDKKIFEHVGLDWGNANNPDNKSHLASDRRKVKSLEAELTTTKIKLAETEDKLKTANARRVEVENELKAKQTELVELNKAYQVAIQDTKKCELAKSKITDEIEKVTIELTDAQIEIEKLKKQLTGENCAGVLTEQLEKITSALEGYSGEKTVDSVVNSISQREATKKRLEERVKELENNPILKFFKAIKQLFKDL